MILDAVFQIHILTCASLARELRLVAEEVDMGFVRKIFPSSCHRDPEAQRQQIEIYIKKNSPQAGFFIAYGCCSHMDLGTGGNIYRLPSWNCAATLLGGNDRYEEIPQNSYFLTPYLALTWKRYFLGDNRVPLDPRTQSRMIKWFQPLERIIRIEMHSTSSEREQKSAQEFADFIQKPLICINGDPTFLRNEYKSFCENIFR